MKVRGLGFVDGLHCPHYDTEAYRRPELHNMMAKTAGIAFALEDGVAMEIVDTQYRIIASRKDGKAFLVRKEGGKVTEKVLENDVWRSLGEPVE